MPRKVVSPTTTVMQAFAQLDPREARILLEVIEAIYGARKPAKGEGMLLVPGRASASKKSPSASPPPTAPKPTRAPRATPPPPAQTPADTSVDTE